MAVFPAPDAFFIFFLACILFSLCSDGFSCIRCWILTLSWTKSNALYFDHSYGHPLSLEFRSGHQERRKRGKRAWNMKLIHWWRRKTQRPNDLAILTLAFAIAIDVYYIMCTFHRFLPALCCFFFEINYVEACVFIYSFLHLSEQMFYTSKLLHIERKWIKIEDNARMEQG